MDNLSILVLEDDETMCTAMAQYASNFDDLSLISITNSAEKAFKDIQTLHPHAVILDLELHNGSGSGIDVIHNLNSIDLKMRPYILVATNNTSAITYDYVRKYGADYIISKHQENYSEKVPIDLLRQMKSIILSDTISSEHNHSDETSEQQIKRVKRRIIVELNRVGINPKHIGYQYLVDAISLTIEKPTEKVFPILAKKYGISERSVVRSIQNSIKHAWKTSNLDDLFRNYTANISTESGIPTISEFIYYYANKVGHESLSPDKE